MERNVLCWNTVVLQHCKENLLMSTIAKAKMGLPLRVCCLIANCIIFVPHTATNYTIVASFRRLIINLKKTISKLLSTVFSSGGCIHGNCRLNLHWFWTRVQIIGAFTSSILPNQCFNYFPRLFNSDLEFSSSSTASSTVVSRLYCSKKAFRFFNRSYWSQVRRSN